MGFFNLLGFGGKRLNESELLEALLTAGRQGDERRFAKLCREHVEVIEAAIPRWQKPADKVIQNPIALNEYTQTIGKTAQILHGLGHPKFWNALVGDPESNPITIWESKINEANALSKELRFDEGAELLINQLIDTRDLKGNATDHLQALSQGLLGHLRFNSGKVELGVGHYEQALKLCHAHNDAEGIRVYLSSLHESHRYLGTIALAADYAQKLAQAWNQAENEAKARRYNRLSQLVRQGEPLLRVVTECDGKMMEMDEVEIQSSTKLVIHFERNRPSLPGATKRIERGKELAGKGKYDDALELFRHAANIDPYEPNAHYQAGMVLCEQQLYAQAVDEYEVCETLAPGWYFCRADLWIAQRLALGTISHELFQALRFLQDGPPNASERMKLATQLRSHAKAIPLFALLSGELLAKTGRAGEARNLWSETLKGEVDSDVRTRMLVLLSQTDVDPAMKKKLLQEAAELNGNLVAAATAGLMVKSL